MKDQVKEDKGRIGGKLGDGIGEVREMGRKRTGS